jgi:MFS family permease
MSEAKAQAAEYQFSRRQIAWGIVAIFMVYGTLSYWLQTLGIARPKMAADLDGMSLYAWSVSLPGLVSAFVTLIFGKLSDIYGRRLILLIALVFNLIGNTLCALSPTFVFLIIASCIGAVGTGSMMPMVFAVVGDLFPPSQRSKWIGLLNIPAGLCSLFGPTLGGWVVDNLNWRYLFWFTLPLLFICLVTVPIGVPSIVNPGAKRKIDLLGCILVAISSSTTIIGFSLAGTAYPWASAPIILLFGISLVFWICFFRAEYRVEEPILDPAVLRNRSFNTVALASFLSFVGQMGMLMYFPMFLQGVQGISTTRSGLIITPYSVLMAFIGVPVGFLLARSKKFKWMYILGYGILTVDMFGLILFNAETPAVWAVTAATLAGIGLGAIPTVNTLVVQNAVPKRLLGVAMGAIFFCLMMGVAISPAILGSAMRATYVSTIKSSLPSELKRIADTATLEALGNDRVLLSQPAMLQLEKTIREKSPDGERLFQETVDAIRNSMEAGLRIVFWLGAITMLIAFLLISTVPATSVSAEEQEMQALRAIPEVPGSTAD